MLPIYLWIQVEMQQLVSLLNNNSVLASKSPRRIELLSALAIKFESKAANLPEYSIEKDPAKRVIDLARQKAIAVSSILNDQRFIIGADTLVEYQGNILGKPTSEAEAITMLKLLAESPHQVFSGVYVIRSNKVICSFSALTTVWFSRISDFAIENYIKTGLPFDRAGSYGIQDDFGKVHIARIEGDYWNVVGFPLQEFCQQMTRAIL